MSALKRLLRRMQHKWTAPDPANYARGDLVMIEGEWRRIA